MKLFTSMDAGGAMMEVIHLKMAKRLLSGDTVRIVANWLYVRKNRTIFKGGIKMTAEEFIEKEYGHA